MDTIRRRLSRRFGPDDQRQTALGGHVICDDREPLCEEAPQAYKDIERVVADLRRRGGAQPGADLQEGARRRRFSATATT